MIRLKFIIPLVLLVSNCYGQRNEMSNKVDSLLINREVYGTKKYIKDLPDYLGIPKGFIIDDYVRMSDKDSDGVNDFIAIKYNEKEDKQSDGDITYWDFYERGINDSIYTKRMTLSNIVPPFIKSVSLEYLVQNPIAEKIYNKYPRRIAHKLSFIVNCDTIRLSYKYDDVYGKTFVFVHSSKENNWLLHGVEYFIGELPSEWWQTNSFYYPLRNDIFVLEKAIPKQTISIDQFSLIEAFRYRELEADHLSEYYINNIDETVGSTILDLKNVKCSGIQLPDDWIY